MTRKKKKKTYDYKYSYVQQPRIVSFHSIKGFFFFLIKLHKTTKECHFILGKGLIGLKSRVIKI